MCFKNNHTKCNIVKTTQYLVLIFVDTFTKQNGSQTNIYGYFLIDEITQIMYFAIS